MRKLLLILFFLPFIGLGQQVDNIDLTNVPIEDINNTTFEREIGPQPLLLNEKAQLNPESLLPVMSFPYPIIFIHGLKGDWHSWYDFYGGFNSLPNNTPATGLNDWGWSYGGLLRFCLNSTGNPASSNVQAVCNINTDITYIPSTLSPGDYYIINFDCGLDLDNTNCGTTNGFENNKLSNQAAIILQGRALGEAIDNVLQATGKEKVILVGHSMGGLAAREYVQNSTHWQGNSDHRVAKIVTSGTPHAGCNTTGFGLPTGFSDERSEAVRDLRSSYQATQFDGINWYTSDGAYLYGQSPIIEDDYWIRNSTLYTYYNVDVNCDASEGGNVFGRNTQLYAGNAGSPYQIPTNLEYISIIGYALLMPWTDEVVSTSSADLSNTFLFPSGVFDKFEVNSFHWNLTEEDYVNFKAIDEPDNSTYAYKLDFGTNYLGHLTFQGLNNSSSSYDSDFYKFTLSQSTPISIIINNLPANTNSLVSIYDVTQNYITGGVAVSGAVTISNVFNAGTYYLKISGNAYGNTITGYFPWDQPYSYAINAFGCTDPLACNYNLQANVDNGNCVYPTSSFYSITSCNSYTWSVNGTTYTQSGTYTDVSTNANGCLHTETLTLTINNAPLVQINPIGQDLQSSVFGGAPPYNYSWNTGSINSFLTPITNGMYSLVVTDQNGCVSNTITYNVTWITTSINEIGIADLSIYPNPSEELFNIEFSSLITQDLQIRIVNIIGEVVISDNLQQFIGEYTKQIDLTNNAKGIYFLEIETNDGVVSKKLILQ